MCVAWELFSLQEKGMVVDKVHSQEYQVKGDVTSTSADNLHDDKKRDFL